MLNSLADELEERKVELHILTPDEVNARNPWVRSDFPDITRLVSNYHSNGRYRFTIIQSKTYELLFSKQDRDVGRNIYEYLRIIDAHMTGEKCLATFGMG